MEAEQALTDEQVSEVATQLARASADRIAIETLVGEPTSLVDAYRVQAVGHELHQDLLVGWKAGVTNDASQQMLGLDGPVVGRYRSAHVLAAPASVTVSEFVTAPYIEVEVGLRLLRDVDTVPDNEMDLADSVEVFAAIEIVAGRLAAAPLLPPGQLVADNVMGARMVVGSTASFGAAEIVGLDAVAVELTIDDEPVAQATGAAAWGHPLRVLQLVARRAESMQSPLRAGQLVITGTCTGLVPARPGHEHVGRVGDAEVRLRVD